MPEGSKSRSSLADSLSEFAAGTVGRLESVRDRSWEHGESAVWSVVGERGRAVLKHHLQPRKFRQEVEAYRHWLPALPHDTARLLDLRETHPRAILLSELPGLPLSELRVSPTVERELHRRAGEFLADLHALPIEDLDPLPLADAYERRCRAWVERAHGILPARATEAVLALALEASPLLRRQRRSACHRDFTPRNWLVAPGGTSEFAVIDFEHARADLYLLDLVRLRTDLWHSRSDLEEAFLCGYGHRLSRDEEALLERLSALAALSTVVWAREHGDAAFEAKGRSALERLGLPL